MTLLASQVFLYGADPVDYANAQSVASQFGLPFGNVTGSFAAAWFAAASGKFLVIAVGSPANNALYYNPCGWSGFARGSTPFSIAQNAPLSSLPGANYYENAAGYTSADSLQLATDFVESALGHSLSYPLPAAYPPEDVCAGVNPAYGG